MRQKVFFRVLSIQLTAGEINDFVGKIIFMYNFVLCVFIDVTDCTRFNSEYTFSLKIISPVSTEHKPRPAT